MSQEFAVDNTQVQKRTTVACRRCRVRKIKCSGPQGLDLGCQQCYWKLGETCVFERVIMLYFYFLSTYDRLMDIRQTGTLAVTSGFIDAEGKRTSRPIPLPFRRSPDHAVAHITPPLTPPAAPASIPYRSPYPAAPAAPAAPASIPYRSPYSAVDQRSLSTPPAAAVATIYHFQDPTAAHKNLSPPAPHSSSLGSCADRQPLSPPFDVDSARPREMMCGPQTFSMEYVRHPQVDCHPQVDRHPHIDSIST